MSHPDPRQPGDRRERHLLGQPRDDVFEVTGVMSTRPGPRHGLGAHTAVRASEQPQLALDEAATRTEIEMPPALDATIVDLQSAGLPAAAADPSPAPEPDRDHDAVAGEADIDDRRPRHVSRSNAARCSRPSRLSASFGDRRVGARGVPRNRVCNNFVTIRACPAIVCYVGGTAHSRPTAIHRCSSGWAAPQPRARRRSSAVIAKRSWSRQRPPISR